MRPITAVLVLAAAVFGVSLTHEFVWDDFSLLTRPWFVAPVTRPLTEFTFWLNWQIHPHPAGFHAVSLALHLLAIWLVHRVLLTALTARAALTGAFVFAVHPLQAEAVNYVWARSTVLMTVLCLLAIQDWIKDRPWRAVAWFTAALLAKQECVTLPLFLLAFDWSRATSDKRDLRWKPAAAMLAVAFCIGGYVFWAANITPGSQAGAQARHTALEYLAAQGAVIGRYLRLLVFPFNGISADPGIDLDLTWLAWLLLALLASLSLRNARNLRPGFWFLAGLLLLLPSSSVFPANDLAADRRMYLPMLGFAAAAGMAAERLHPRWTYLLAGLLAALSMRQNFTWHSEQTLWTSVLASGAANTRAMVRLAAADPSQAITLLEKARHLAPDDAAVATALGRAYLNTEGPARALPEFGRALALQPNSAEAISNRGVALLAMDQRDAARADFERALRIDPCLFEPRLNLRRMGLSSPAPPQCRYREWQQEALNQESR